MRSSGARAQQAPGPAKGPTVRRLAMRVSCLAARLVTLLVGMVLVVGCAAGAAPSKRTGASGAASAPGARAPAGGAASAGAPVTAAPALADPKLPALTT